MKETTHGTEVRKQGNKPYFRKFEGLLQRSHATNKWLIKANLTGSNGGGFGGGVGVGYRW
ncbi:hypothetical protein [Oligella sp. MSHR50489EDL]|uniref:hypothetical protein n=1 Tax=Oligella sp. MSHR50489EDL TaxID=3139409 RepID=UPI003D81626C